MCILEFCVIVLLRLVFIFSLFATFGCLFIAGMQEKKGRDSSGYLIFGFHVVAICVLSVVAIMLLISFGSNVLC